MKYHGSPQASISTEINTGLLLPLMCYIFLSYFLEYELQEILVKNDDWTQARPEPPHTCTLTHKLPKRGLHY